MKRTKFRNNFLKHRTAENKADYTKQKIYVLQFCGKVKEDIIKT